MGVMDKAEEKLTGDASREALRNGLRILARIIARDVVEKRLKGLPLFPDEHKEGGDSLPEKF